MSGDEGSEANTQREHADPTTDITKTPPRKAGGFLYASDGSSIIGINNSASKYAENKPVAVNDEPFDARLERAIAEEARAMEERHGHIHIRAALS